MLQQGKYEKDLINCKRLAFAEEIRTKQRQQTKNQIKLNFQQTQNALKLMANFEHNLPAIIQLMRQNKNYEIIFCDHIARKLQQSEVVIVSYNYCWHWGMVICFIVENKPALIQPMLKKILPGMVHISEYVNNFDIVFNLIVGCMSVIKESKEKSMFSQFPLMIGQFLNQYKNRDNFSFSLPELRFYNYCFLIYHKIMEQFITDNWLQCIIAELKSTFEEKQKLQILIKIYSLLVYYCEEQKILTYFQKNEIIDHLKTVIKFYNPCQWNLISKSCTLLTNIVLTFQAVDMRLVGFLSDLSQIFAMENNKSFPEKQNSIKTFLTILSYVSFTEEEKQYLRQIDVIKTLIFIMNKYGDKINGIVEDVLEVLNHFLKVDANYNERFVNSYHLKFHYENGYEVLRRFPEESQDFLSIYKEPE